MEGGEERKSSWAFDLSNGRGERDMLCAGRESGAANNSLQCEANAFAMARGDEVMSPERSLREWIFGRGRRRSLER